jgi:hypothetical protein
LKKTEEKMMKLFTQNSMNEVWKQKSKTGRFSKLSMWLTVFMLTAFIGGCGVWDREGPLDPSDSVAPTVSSTNPADNAVGVTINSKLTATFSEEMSASTINAATFMLKGPGTTAVAGTVTYVGTTATFTPSANLAGNTLFTATITTGVKDLAGNAMEGSFVWTFTTGATPDTTLPTVSSTVPVNNAINVLINSKITASFSEAMDPSTMTAATFMLKGPGTTAVAGTVTYVGTTATFTPSANLAGNTLFTATITTGVKDLAGNAMAGSFIWSFTTGATPDTTPPAVISTVPVNNATGVLINSKITASFSEAMDPSTLTTATFMVKGPGTTAVAGTVTYVGTTATFTPSANLAGNTLFTATVTVGAKDLAGNAIVSNFNWAFLTGATPDTTLPTVSSTVPVNNAVNVLINSKLTATFSEDMDPSTMTAATFMVKGPGTTAVAGTVTYVGTTATFTPSANLAGNTLFTATVTTGVKDLAGNAMAGSFIWSFTTGATPDTTPPAVISTVPVNNATGVLINSKITATFSEAMDPSTLTTATFMVKGPGTTAVAGTVTYVGTTATFTPSANLAGNTLFTATVTVGAKDLAGNAMTNFFDWSFLTGATPDTTPPEVISTVPVNNATGVLINSKITASFSEAMDQLTVTTATFMLKGPGTTAVAGTVTYAGTTATFTPSANLAGNTLFTATITTGVKDLAGNAMTANFVWTFTTGATPDTTPPEVISTVPVNNATGVLINSKITATFSEAMDASTLTTATFMVKGPGTTAVAGVVTYTGTIATFTPSANLAGNTVFTATITAGAKDLAGNALESDFGGSGWTFTTGATPDTTPPTVISTLPADNATNVLVNSNVTATFSEAMDASTITTVTFMLKGPGTTAVAGAVTYAGTTATFNPTNDLAGNTLFTATITTGTKDLAGNALAVNYVWTFTTGATPDTTPPTVISTLPVDNAIDVFVTSNLTATFSEAMDALTITALTFTLKGPGITPVAGAVTYVGTSAIFNPTNDLAGNTLYTATITTGAKDLAGNAIESDHVWTFTTEDKTPPAVISTLPLDSAINVLVNTNLTVTFSEEMDALTITTVTFKLEGPGTTPVEGVVTCVGTTAIFNPTNDLAGSTLFTATITTGAKDLAGNAIESDYVWTFTTEDITPPEVISTLPVNNAANVSIHSNITAKFSEKMDALTITSVTFVLQGPGTTSVAGTVSYLDSVATFNPANALEGSTLFTATITTGAKDLAGNAMESDYIWTFTTGLSLGGAESFGGFGGAAGMTNQGIFTVVNGDIGTTAASTLITGFHDSDGNVYTETPLNIGYVTGLIHTATAPPGSAAGVIAAACALDAEAAYIKLSPAALPGGIDVSTFGGGAGELGSRVLAPGVYKSAPGTFEISLGDLTLDGQGDPDALWVFQMESSLTVGIAGPDGARSVILINGAQTKNVFWQVGSFATINGAGGGTMEGTIIASDGVSFSTAGNVVLTTLNGRALGLNASVTLVNTIINVPAP